MEGVGNATTLLEIEPETKHLVSRILPIVIPVFIAILLVSSRRSSYDAARVGKSRWWSLIPGQVPMRFEMDRWAERGYRKAGASISAMLDWAN